jgi:hypothetical protein
MGVTSAIRIAAGAASHGAHHLRRKESERQVGKLFFVFGSPLVPMAGSRLRDAISFFSLVEIFGITACV